MGNDWPNSIDTDGGWRSKRRAERMRQKAIAGGLDPGELVKVGKHWGFNTFQNELSYGDRIGGVEGAFNFTKGFLNNLPGQINPTSGLVNFQFWRNKAPENFGDVIKHTTVELTYGTAENVYSLFSGGRTFSGSQLQGDHRVDSGLDGFTTVATLGYGQAVKSGLTTLKSTPSLYNQFAKNTKGLFKGPNHAQLRSEAYHQMIKNHNIKTKNLENAFELWDTSNDMLEVIEINKQ